MAQLSLVYQLGSLVPADPGRALMYEVARREVAAARGERVDSDRLLAALGSQLTEEERATAASAGRELARKCCGIR